MPQNYLKCLSHCIGGVDTYKTITDATLNNQNMCLTLNDQLVHFMTTISCGFAEESWTYGKPCPVLYYIAHHTMKI